MATTTHRYTRLIELGWQREIIQNATVIIAGMGALGNEAAKNLALLGIGKLIIIDFDVIENHNLTRTVLFSEADIGKNKAEVAARQIKKINPHTEVIFFDTSLQQTLGLGFFRRANIVLGCVDNVEARLYLNDYAYLMQVPFIDAGLRQLDGDVKIFAPPYTVCYNCTISAQMRREAWLRFSCLKLRDNNLSAPTLPTAPTIASVMAGLQVQVAMRYLHHPQSVAVGSRLSVFGYTDSFNTSLMSQNADCPTHQLLEPIPIFEIVELPLSYTQTTVNELLAIAQKDLGVGATLQLLYELVTHATCPTHPVYIKKILKPVGAVFVDEMQCPYCVAENKLDDLTQNLLQSNFITEITPKTPDFVLQSTLQQIGMPMLQVIKAQCYNAESEVFIEKYYELTGDLPPQLEG